MRIIAGSRNSFGGSRQVDKIFTSAVISLLVLVVSNQGIGADRDNLVEKIHGEEVVGKGDADCSKDGQGETGIEPGLGMLLRPRM
jgi:hypothetical protein